MKLNHIEYASEAIEGVLSKETDPSLRLGLLHATRVLDAVVTFKREAPSVQALAQSRDALHALVGTLLEEA